MIVKDFQPIHLKFCSDDSDCNCGKKGCDQVALLTDKVGLQFDNLEYFVAPEWLVEAGDGSYYGDFHDAAAFNNNFSQTATADIDWVHDVPSETAQVTLAVGEDSETLYTDTIFAFTECFAYRICINIEPDFGANCDFLIQLRNNAGGALTTIKTYEGPTAGRYCFVYYATETINRQLGFRIEGTCEGVENETYIIDNASLKAMTIDIEIINCCNDSVVDTVAECDIFKGEEGYANVQFQWDKYVSDDKCYKICLNDVDLILGGDFATINDPLDYWSEQGPGEAWQFGQPGFAASNLMYVELAIGEESYVISQGIEDNTFAGGSVQGVPMQLPPGCTYPLSFKAGSTAGDVTDWELELLINEEVVQTYPAIGGVLLDITYNITLNVALDSIGFVIRDLRVGGPVVDIQIGLDVITMPHDICSDCICVKESHNCTHLIKSWNDDHTENFYFEDDFFFSMRVNSKFRNFRYPTIEELYNASNGLNTLNYYKSEKIWDFQFKRIPEYLWDALSTLVGLDHFQIDGTNYVKVEGDIEPASNRNNDYLTAGSIEVKKKLENRVK